MDYLKNKIKQIKYLRLKPEERFILDCLTDLVEYIHYHHLEYIFYKKHDDILFQWNQKDGYFYCSYTNFWSILQSKYNLKYDEIKILVKYMVEEYLIKKDIISTDQTNRYYIGSEEYLIKKDITPYIMITNNEKEVINHLIKKDITIIDDRVINIEGLRQQLIKKYN